MISAGIVVVLMTPSTTTAATHSMPSFIERSSSMMSHRRSQMRQVVFACEHAVCKVGAEDVEEDSARGWAGSLWRWSAVMTAMRCVVGVTSR